MRLGDEERRTREREIASLRDRGDLRAAGTLAILLCDRILRHTAQRYARGHRHASLEDFVQVGRMALLASLPSYDPSLGTLWTWTELSVRARMAEYAHRSHLVRVPRRAIRHGAAVPRVDGGDALALANPVDPGPTPDEILAGRPGRRLEAALASARARLTRPQLEALEAQLRGEDPVATAARLGISRQAVAHRRETGLRRLRNALEGLLDDS